jgi:hypothetical protein
MAKGKLETFKALVFQPGKAPELREAPNTVEGMQSLIGGGYVELVGRLTPELSVYADEDGRRKQLAPCMVLPNAVVLVGPVFVARTSRGEFADVTDGDVEWIQTILRRVGRAR